MPRYRENSLIMPFSMLCPGISQNTKHHYLNLYKGQVSRSKAYLDLCGNNIINIAYHEFRLQGSENSDYVDIMHRYGQEELYVPPIPGLGFISDYSQIPWDSEILQSFAELTQTTSITFHDEYRDSLDGVTYQIQVGDWACTPNHHEQCLPPNVYYAIYFWTKEGFKIRI